jgi:hypothetical protein
MVVVSRHGASQQEGLKPAQSAMRNPIIIVCQLQSKHPRRDHKASSVVASLFTKPPAPQHSRFKVARGLGRKPVVSKMALYPIGSSWKKVGKRDGMMSM